MPSIALPVSLRGQLLSGSRFNPVSLFSAGEQGIWLEPSDLTTMFQDRAGTTPVTTPGQTIGLRLDKSKGLALGSELVTNGDFSGGSTGWTQISGIFTFSGGRAIAANSDSIKRLSNTASSMVAGRWYVITWNQYAGVGTGAANWTIPGVWSGTDNFANSGNYINGEGQKTVYFYAQASGQFYLYNFEQAVEYDNISVKELLGNHAVAPTDAARPTYGIEPKTGRRDLLTRTEEFGDAVWTKDSCTVPATQYLAPDGTTTAERIVSASATAVTGVGQSLSPSIATSAVHTASYYVQANGARYIQLLWSSTLSTNFANFDLQNPTAPTSGTYTAATISAASNGFYRITITSTLAASSGGSFLWLLDSGTAGRGASYTGNGTSGIYIWGAQLELGSTATAYQRVGTAFDVTEAGVPTVHYVQYDGTDDSFSTSSIDFTATDKMSVFAGVRKLSDGSYPTIIELSANSDGNNGSFLLAASRSSVLQDYFFQSRGTSAVSTLSSVIAAPASNVIVGLADIVGDRATLRVNGTQASQSTADQGTGNFGNYPLFIGRRNNASSPFNGRDYGILIVGKAVTPTEITNTESYLAANTSGVSI